VTRGDRFGSEVRVKVAGGVDALFDTAVLGSRLVLGDRDGGAYVPVRGWDGSPSERDIRIRPVMVMEALTRTDWLNELRIWPRAVPSPLRVAGEYPPERAADAHRAMEGRRPARPWHHRLLGPLMTLATSWHTQVTLAAVPIAFNPDALL